MTCVVSARADTSFEMSFRADRSIVTIGDEITLEIDVTHGQSYRLLPLPKELKLPPFELKRIEQIPPRGAGGAIKTGYRIVFTVFELGDFTITPIEVNFINEKGKKGRVFTDPVKISARSIGRSEKDKDDVRPLKKPFRMEAGPEAAKIGMILAGILVFLGIFGAVIWFFVTRKRPDPESLLPPPERALYRLKKLEERGLLQTGQLKAFYTELTRILVRYFIEAFGLGSEDLTSAEFNVLIQKSHFTPDAQRDIMDFFGISDLVKFAKWTPPADEPRRSLEMTRSVIERTRPEPEKVT